MHYAKLVVATLLFIGITFLGFDTVQRTQNLQLTKAQYAEVNHFSYGLFSVDQWKRQLSKIVSDEISGLSFKGETATTLRKHLERQLAVLIDSIAARIKKTNYKTTEGWLKQSFIDSFVNVNDIKAGIPQYADAMMKELTAPGMPNFLKGDRSIS